MNHFLCKPAWTPPPVYYAEAWPHNPARTVANWFGEVLRTRMDGLPFLNPRLAVEVEMRRLRGDWLGTLITPWSLQLLLLPGGGELWLDIPAGCRRRVALPVGELDFIADAGEGGLPAYQYCPLASGVTTFADMPAAREFARDALETVLAPPPEAANDALPAEAVSHSRRSLLGLGRGR